MDGKGQWQKPDTPATGSAARWNSEGERWERGAGFRSFDGMAGAHLKLVPAHREPRCPAIPIFRQTRLRTGAAGRERPVKDRGAGNGRTRRAEEAVSPFRRFAGSSFRRFATFVLRGKGPSARCKGQGEE